MIVFQIIPFNAPGKSRHITNKGLSGGNEDRSPTKDCGGLCLHRLFRGTLGSWAEVLWGGGKNQEQESPLRQNEPLKMTRYISPC